MAKSKDKLNKSQAIRDELQANPRGKAKEIVASLAKKGIKVTIPLVYYIKSHGKNKKRKQKRQAALSVSKASGSSDPVQAVIQVRMLAAQLGGISNLKKLVDVLAE